jgi:23S rRNA (pseudouridine1915-N3)-methyltransferase
MAMTIKVVSVGTKPSPELTGLITDYTKRLPRTISVTWQYLKHANTGDVTTSKHQESESILRVLSPSDYVILLDENGELITSTRLSRLLFDAAKDVVFVIGGAYGVSDSVKNRANFVWSLSTLVFPHQIVRLLLSEQLYRAHAIHVNHPYHHS